MLKREKLLLPTVVGVWLCAILYIILKRSYFGFDTETDFLGGFMPEAQRLLEGSPLALEFHPPLYSAVLSLYQLVLDDWFLSGKLLSLTACLVVFVSNFYLFRALIGELAAWGAILALMASTPFLHDATLASSDLFFLSLYSSAVLFAVLAYRNQKTMYWLACGVLISLVLLSRTNGFTLLSILLLPWILADKSFRYKLLTSITILTGIAVPLIAWSVIAISTGSPLMPGGTYANIALTYFSPSGIKSSGYDRVILEAKFNNIWEVLAYDPVHIIKSYIRDLYHLLRTIFLSERLISLTSVLFLFPGFIILALRREKLMLFFIFIITLSQILLVNFKGFEPRFYLFVIPLYGVAVAVVLECLLQNKLFVNIELLKKSSVVALVLLTIFIIPVIQTLQTVSHKWSSNDQLVADILTKLPELPVGSTVLASLPQIPYYLNNKQLLFPQVASLVDLKNLLNKIDSTSSIYLFYGHYEFKKIPQLEYLRSITTKQYPWLTLIAKSTLPGQWVFYKFDFQINQQATVIQ